MGGARGQVDVSVHAGLRVGQVGWVGLEGR
jgi:hypothetical protein